MRKAILFISTLLITVVIQAPPGAADSPGRPGPGDRDLLLPPMLLAQLDDDTGGDWRGMPERRIREHFEQREKRRRQLEQFRMLKLLELLELTEEQETPFITDFADVRTDIRDLDEQRRAQVERLARIVTADNGEKDAINGMIDELMRIEAAKRQRMLTFLNEIRNYLTPEQVAKFVIFQERFEYELLEQMKQFQDRRRGGRGPGSGQGQGPGGDF